MKSETKINRLTCNWCGYKTDTFKLETIGQYTYYKCEYCQHTYYKDIYSGNTSSQRPVKIKEIEKDSTNKCLMGYEDHWFEDTNDVSETPCDYCEYYHACCLG